ncbi:MAG: ATP-binding cassette domain-containing protein [Flavobacteriaceae bacterium]|nr:ATP-binding cassette domain-containing protein [Eudoraea sp.]NNJ38515.1 ATP-binding cassette domain-containing protein [Flavobacteriaceae bacterium]
MAIAHWTIFADNESDKDLLFKQLLEARELPHGFAALQGMQGGLLSPSEIDRYIEEEERHDHKILTRGKKQHLQTMSSGERKKALLNHLLKQPLDYLILDNPLDNLDVSSRADLLQLLKGLANKISIIQLVNRWEDSLPFRSTFYLLRKNQLSPIEDPITLLKQEHNRQFIQSVPQPLEPIPLSTPLLVSFKQVSVSYGEKPVLHEISWELKSGEYWQLSGPNGSGKTTLLSLITGESPKAYGQDITLFGKKKGSGESVWDIKEKLGYFTPAMTDRFSGYHSLENMLISGLYDSIGLYVKPSPAEQRLAQDWIAFLGMEALGKRYFHELSPGQQRLIMCVRAMIKHPPLLILDEPTTGLDDSSAAMVVDLVNRMAEASKCCIVFVSHRKEPGLKPQYTLVLKPDIAGSKGAIEVN